MWSIKRWAFSVVWILSIVPYDCYGCTARGRGHLRINRFGLATYFSFLLIQGSSRSLHERIGYCQTWYCTTSWEVFMRAGSQLKDFKLSFAEGSLTIVKRLRRIWIFDEELSFLGHFFWSLFHSALVGSCRPKLDFRRSLITRAFDRVARVGIIGSCRLDTPFSPCVCLSAFPANPITTWSICSRIFQKLRAAGPSTPPLWPRLLKSGEAR